MAFSVITSCREGTRPIAFYTYDEFNRREFGPFDPKVQLRELTVRDPVADAERAWRKGDARAFAVVGFVATIPGLPPTMADQEDDFLKNAKIIRGTHDNVRTTQGIQLQGAAAAYAERYNERLFELLNSKSGNRKNVHR